QDDGGSPPRPYLTRVFQAPIATSADGKDSRGIAIDPSQRQECEQPCRTVSESCVLGCAATDAGCRTSGALAEFPCVRPLHCTDIPLRLFVANRAPAALLTGKIETTLVEDTKGNVIGAFDVPSIEDTVPLTFGASKVAIGKVIGQDGKPSTRVFAAAF